MIAESARVATERARQALRFMQGEVRGLQAAASVLALSALLSSVLALVRDRLLAHTFGASTALDIYYASFRIPDLIFVALGALVSVYMIIPVLAARDETSQRNYIDTVISGFSLVAVIVCGLAAIFTPLIVQVIFPQLSIQGLGDEITTLTRILLLQPIALGVSNIMAALTQVRYRYALYSLSPLLYNLGIIAGIVFLYPVFGLSGLAWGVVAGALMHLAVLVPSVVRDGFLHRIPRLVEPWALLETVRVSLPRALTLSMNQINVIGLTALAAYLTSGSIAVFMFAFNLQAVPLAIIGASYSVAAFPTLARAFSLGNRIEFVSIIVSAAKYVLFWSIPATALIIVLRAHIVRVILGSGNFDWTDTRLTAAAFALFSLSLTAQGIMLLVIRGYYAAGRTFVPFIISLGMLIATLSFSALSMFAFAADPIRDFIERLLRVQDIPGTAILGLPFVYAIVTIVGCVVLLLHFEYRFGGLLRSLGRTFLESLGAGLAAGAGAYVFLNSASAYVSVLSPADVFLQGLAAGFCGIVCGILAYFATGSAELKDIHESIKSKTWRRARMGGSLVASGEDHSTL
jgi:putative peptidoglycan lipid II flippase